jgi:hypothetical protein
VIHFYVRIWSCRCRVSKRKEDDKASEKWQDRLGCSIFRIVIVVEDTADLPEQ